MSELRPDEAMKMLRGCDPATLSAVARCLRVLCPPAIKAVEQLADPRATHRIAFDHGRESIVNDLETIIKQGA